MLQFNLNSQSVNILWWNSLCTLTIKCSCLFHRLQLLYLKTWHHITQHSHIHVHCTAII